MKSVGKLSKGAQKTLICSRDLIKKNPYVRKMYNEYAGWVFDEQEAPSLKGHWRTKAFQATLSHSLNVEIGSGAGDHFAHLAVHHIDRLYLAVEMKYKPLIQTVRKVVRNNCSNAKVIRYNGRLLNQIFGYREINNVYIHFPDPWPKKRHHKHRLIHPDFVKILHSLQQAGSFVEIKTDSSAYIQDIQQIFHLSAYQQMVFSSDWNKERGEEDVMTFFENIFAQKGTPVYYLRYVKKEERISDTH